MIPYLDYTTPTFYDDITARSRSCWPASRSPDAFTEGRAGGVREVALSPAEADRRSGRPPARRAAARRLPVPAAGVRGLRAVRAAAAGARGVALAVRLGRADGRRRGPGSTTTASLHGPGAARRVRARADPAVFYAVLPIAIGLLLAGVMARARVRGLALFRTILFLPQVIAMVVVAVMWKMIYEPDDGPLNETAARGRARDRWRRSWLGDFSLALPSVGLIGTWVYCSGWRWCCSRRACRRSRTSLYDAARVDGAGRSASSSRSRCRGCAARSRSR